jgi:hypothetical protein
VYNSLKNYTGFLMNKRLYPITEDYFKEHIYCHLVEFKDGRGRPALIKDYDFFCAIVV